MRGAEVVGGGGWSCINYDGRGRITSRTFPAWGGQAARTVTYNYAVNGNPLTVSVTDPAGTITTTFDLLGRVVSYKDVWGQTTTHSYDQPGRGVTTRSPQGRIDTDFDPGGRITAQYWADDRNGAKAASPIATPHYDATTGELAWVDYANGTHLASSAAPIPRDFAGRVTKLTWSGTLGLLLASDEVVYSQAGRVVDQRIDGTDPYPGTGSFGDPGSQNFLYDALGRLTSARTPGHEFVYGYGTVAGCSVAPSAGRNTNRSSVTDNGGAPTTYCYDKADRLLSSTDSAVGIPTYDARGNTRTLGNQTLTWDGVDRHMATAVSGGATVTYKRDATGRIVERTEGTSVVRYGYGGVGDAPGFTLTNQNVVIDRHAGAGRGRPRDQELGRADVGLSQRPRRRTRLGECPRDQSRPNPDL